MAYPYPVIAAPNAEYRHAGHDSVGDTGPWTYSASSPVFSLFVDDANHKIEMQYSPVPASPGQRGDTWSVADQLNEPTAKTAADFAEALPSGCRVGNTIWVFQQDISGNLMATPFSMTALTWGSAVTGGPAVVLINLSTSLQDRGNGIVALYVGPSATGSLIRVLFNGATIGGRKMIYSVTLDTGTGMWSIPFLVNNNDGLSSYELRAGLVATGFRCHVFYARSASNTAVDRIHFHRSIDFDDTLNTEQTIYNQGSVQMNSFCFGDTWADLDTGIVNLAVPLVADVNVDGATFFAWHDMKVARAETAADPIWTIETTSTDPIQPEGFSRENTMAAVYLRCGELYYFYKGLGLALAIATSGGANGDRDLWYTFDQGLGAGWVAAALLADAAAFVPPPFADTWDIDGIRARSIDSGNGIGVMFTTENRPWYWELQIPGVCCPPATGGEGKYAYFFQTR